MKPGLGLARHIVDDLRELEPSAWLFWQPVEDYDNMKPGGESAKGGNWGTVQVPFSCTATDTLETCPVRTNTKFDTARNFTRFIRPGDRLVGVNDTTSTAAVPASGRGATVVHVNDSTQAREVTVDLSGFAAVSPGATVTPVVTDTSGALVRRAPVAVSGTSATVTVPAQSVTSLLVTGVSGVARDAAPIQPGRPYRLTGTGSGKALDVSDDGTGAVIRTTDAADRGQLWRVRRTQDGNEKGRDRGDRADNRARYVVTSAVDGHAAGGARRRPGPGEGPGTPGAGRPVDPVLHR